MHRSLANVPIRYERMTPESPIRDEFLSEEDLDFACLSFEEQVHYWNLWLRQAQATNAMDADEYSHGVMMGYKEPRRGDEP